MRNGLVYSTEDLKIALNPGMVETKVENEHGYVVGNFALLGDDGMDGDKPSRYNNTWCFRPTRLVQYDGLDLTQLAEIQAFLTSTYR